MFQYIWIIAFIAAIWYRISVSNKAKKGEVVDVLSGKEQLFVWILCIFSPILAGAIFYYGWIKALPNKAKKANSISLWAVLIEIIIGGALFYLLQKVNLVAKLNNNSEITTTTNEQSINQNYTYTLPTGWQKVASSSQNLAAVNQISGYDFILQRLPLPDNIQPINELKLSDIEVIILKQYPKSTIINSKFSSIGGENATIITFQNQQAANRFLEQCTVFHNGFAYNLIFISGYSQKDAAMVDFQSIVDSFTFK